MKKLIVTLLAIVLLLVASVCSANTDMRYDVNRYQTETASSSQNTGDKALYDRAYSLYENKNYFDAHELFIQSQYGDWERMAKKCVRRWPKNGETWHDSTQWLRDTRLSFKVDQPDDVAIFIRIYKDEKPLSNVFIGGSDVVSVMIPGNGTYTIKDGVGSEWYGTDDTFGARGAYETMTFGEYEETTIYLEARNEYMITINVEDVIGEDIGSEAEEWKKFK